MMKRYCFAIGLILAIVLAGAVAGGPSAPALADGPAIEPAASGQNEMASGPSVAAVAADNATEPAASDQTNIEAPDMEKIRADYLQLPLHFEANEGQVGSGVDYLAHGNGYSMYLTSQGIVVTLRKNPLPKLKFDEAEYTAAELAAFEAGTAAMGIQVLGGNLQPQVAAREELDGKINYYIGNEPDKWIENVATYAKVEYRQVYPGIDLVYYGNQQRLEFDFVVAPGADPNLIRLNFAGADKAVLAANGDLVLTIDGKEMRQHKPIIYQEINGERREISGGYVLDGTQASFEIGAYDASQTLVIDPILQYSTFLGGNGQEPGYDIDADPAGNIYVTGVTNSMTADTGQGPNTSGQIEPFPILNPWTLANPGNPNSATSGALCCGGNDTGRVFVTKMNPTGSALVYSTFLGGFAGFAGVHQKCIAAGGCGSAPGFARGWDTGHGIAADSAGNAYVTGWAESLDFPTTSDATRKSHPGPAGCDPGPPNESTGPCYWHHYKDHPRDAFIAKFGPTGALLYSSLIGGRMGDGGLSVEVADSGPGMGVYVVGINQSPDFFGDDAVSLSSEGPGPGTHYPAVAAYQSNLNVKTVSQGGFVPDAKATPPTAGVNGVTTTCTGSTTLPDWSCWRDAFAMRLDYNNLAIPIWSTTLGGTADEGAYGVTVDKTTGEAVVVGESESTDFPVTANAFQPCLGGNGSYHAEPTLTKAGDTSTDTGSGPGIGVGLPFPCHMSYTPGVGETNSFRKPNVDGFVAKFAPNGTAVFVTYLGGSMDDDIGATLDDLAGDFGKTVAVDELGNIYLTGWTESTSTPIAMCGPLPNPDAADGGQPCPYTVPFPTSPGAYITNLPQDPVAVCGSQPGFPPPDPDCVPPNRRLHATAFVTKMTPTGQLGPVNPRGADVPRGPEAPAGTTFSTYLGGYGDDAAFAIAIDSLHQIYVAGVGESVNFPGTANSGSLTAAFPLVVPIPGNHYVDHGPACPNCGKYIGGIAPPYDPDRPPQASDGFIVKMKADGTGLIYSSFVGGSGDEVVHGIVHSTRSGFHGIYISGLTGSQDVPPVPEACPPGTDPCPPPPPVPWHVFPVTGTGSGTLPGTASAPTGMGDPPYQPRHGVTRTTTCGYGPADRNLWDDETADWPCSPPPSDPNEDTFIMRLNDAPDEFPAPPVGSVTTAGFSLTPSSSPVRVPVNQNQPFTITIASTGGYSSTVTLVQSSSSPSLTITPASATSAFSGTYAPVVFTATSSVVGAYTATITGTGPGLITPTVISVPVLVVIPDFALSTNSNSVSFAQVGGSGAFSASITPLDTFSSTVSLSRSIIPASGLTVTPTGTISVASPYAPTGFNMTASTPGTYAVTLTGSSNTPNGTLVHSHTVTVTARPPDYILAANPKDLIFAHGGSGPFTITVGSIDGFAATTATVNLTPSSTPAGLNISPGSASSATPGLPPATFTASSSVTGTYTVTVTGTSGALTRSTTLTVTVPFNTGFRSPTANSTANTSGDGNGYQITPTNAYTDDGLFAEDRDSGQSTGTACLSQNKDSHRFFNYGFNIPTGAIVTGIEVRLDAKVDAITGTPMICAQIQGGGATATKSTPTLTTSEATYILGSASDTWGGTWNPTNLSNGTFQVRLIDISGAGTTDFFLDWVSVRVHYRQAGPPVPPPSFTIAAAPSGLTTQMGATGTFTVSTSPSGSFSGTVTLNHSATPGLTVTPVSATSGSPSYPARAFNVTTNTPGLYTVTVTGTSGSMSNSTLVTVTVGNSDFSLATTPATNLSFAQVAGSGQFTVSTTPLGSFTGLVNLTHSVTPAGLTVTPSSASSTSPGYPARVFTATSSTAGTYTVTITGTSGSLVHTKTLTVTVRPPNFTLAGSPNNFVVASGTSRTFNVNITAVDGFASSINLTRVVTPTTGLAVSPASATRASPYPPTTFTATASITGNYLITVTGTGGSLVRTANVLVTVPSVTPFRNPTADSPTANGDANGFELTPTNAYSNNALYAVDTDSGINTTISCTDAGKDSHVFYNYGFTLPAGVEATGIQVRLEANVDAITGTPRMCVQLSPDGGVTWTTAKSTPLLTTSEAPYVLGSFNDTWGPTWTDVELNTKLRVRVINVSGAATTDFSLDWVAVRIYYAVPGLGSQAIEGPVEVPLDEPVDKTQLIFLPIITKE